MDRFTALRVFVAVVEAGGFAAAARRIGLSNAAVSKNVADLEAHLGVQLIARTTRRMRLTEAGEVYHRRVAALLDGLRDADEAVSDLDGVPRGLLRVTAPMSFGLARLTALVPVFLARHPAVSLDLELDDAAVDLAASRFDLAVRGSGVLADSSLRARKLTDLPRVLCASPEYLARSGGAPAEPEALRGHRCIVYTRGPEPDLWRFQRGGAVRAVAVAGPYRVNNSIAIRDALLAGAGLSVIPRLYVEGDLRAGRVVEVLGAWRTEPQAVFAIFPATRFLPRRTRAFIDFLAEALRPAGPGDAPSP